MSKIPTYLDRYPAKMVSHLAARLVENYALDAKSLLDPFCGSGAILWEAAKRGISTSGFDLNPYGVLLSRVKVEGFDERNANRLWLGLRADAQKHRRSFPIDWATKDYWFTPATLNKFEALRSVFREADVSNSQAGRAILLAFALSVRRCSRADQRSPKPFISKTARTKRGGRHFDPFLEIDFILEKLSERYGKKTGWKAAVWCDNVVEPQSTVGTHTHVITSPPYINAQDYFRNFKLELHCLEGLLRFSVPEIKERFIGTERDRAIRNVPSSAITQNGSLFDEMPSFRRNHPREAAIVDCYLWSMSQSMKTISKSLTRGGMFVLVCGDNLVAGHRIPTWRILNSIAEDYGFVLKEQFGDRIECRHVPPKRNGHKGLIKQEVVSVFVKARASTC